MALAGCNGAAGPREPRRVAGTDVLLFDSGAYGPYMFSSMGRVGNKWRRHQSEMLLPVVDGPVGGNGRPAQLAHEIWRNDLNKRGGLLERPVEFVRYDDQGDVSRVPSLYARLMDHDQVDLVIGGYGTNTILSAMPEIVERQRFFVGLMGLGVNNELAYPNYFAMIQTGSDPNATLTEGFFEVASRQSPQPKTVALLTADPYSPETRYLALKQTLKNSVLRWSMKRSIRFRPLTSHRCSTKWQKADAIFCFCVPTFRTRLISFGPSMRTASSPRWSARQ